MKRFFSFLLFSGVFMVLCAGELAAKSKAKYVFYFIGDGMGLNQVLGGSVYAQQLEGKSEGYKDFSFTRFPVRTYVTSYSLSGYVTDSAAGGTALASGEKTNNGMIGVTPRNGETPAYSIAYYAKQAGYKVGVASNVGVNHATPASFFAHHRDRNEYYAIGLQLPDSQFDFFAGSNFLTDSKSRELTPLKTIARQAGYAVAFGVDRYEALKGKASKMILFQADSMKSDVPYRIDRKTGDLTLSQITEKAIDFLARDNKKGFFLMVEGGKIDGGGHANDALASYSEVMDLSDAIEVALDFYGKYPDETLIVLTADHETGGLTLGVNNQYALNYPALLQRKGSKDAISLRFGDLRLAKENKLSWQDVRGFLQENFGFWKDLPISLPQEIRLMQAFQESFGGRPAPQRVIVPNTGERIVSVAVEILDEIALVGWTSEGHSGAYVPLYVLGAGSELFAQEAFDNTDIPRIISKVAGYQDKK